MRAAGETTNGHECTLIRMDECPHAVYSTGECLVVKEFVFIRTTINESLRSLRKFSSSLHDPSSVAAQEGLTPDDALLRRVDEGVGRGLRRGAIQRNQRASSPPSDGGEGVASVAARPGSAALGPFVV